MKTIALQIPTTSQGEAITIQNALQQIANNFSKENIMYIAELSRKPGANEKFDRLKKNPFVKSLL